MQIERYRPGQGIQRQPTATGCLILIAVLVLVVFFMGFVLFPHLPGFALLVAGFEPVGEVDTVFNEAPTAIPMTELQNITAPDQIMVDVGSLGMQQFDGSSTAYTVEIGMATDSGAAETMHVTIDEDGLLQLCNQYSDICGTTNSLVRNARFDLRPGGAVVNAEVFTEQVGWQAVGIVIQLDETDRVDVVGVDIGGTLYALPDGQIGDMAAEIEQRANQALREATVQAGGGSFRLSDIIIDDRVLTLILN